MLITSKDNPNVRLYRRLCVDKKVRSETRLFAVEGMRSCVDTAVEADAGRVGIKAFFYTKEALAKYERRLPTYYFDRINADRRFEITPALAKIMSQEPTDQGVFIIAEQLHKPFVRENLDGSGKYLVLCNVQDPGNLGTLIRTADALGISGVVFTDNCCDLYNPKTVRSAMGSMPRIDLFVEKELQSVCALFREMGIRTAAAWVHGGISVTEYDFSRPCAVVIGNEGRGLTNQQAAMCADMITIKMQGNTESLNAASAGTIILWEMTRKLY